MWIFRKVPSTLSAPVQDNSYQRLPDDRLHWSSMAEFLFGRKTKGNQLGQGKVIKEEDILMICMSLMFIVDKIRGGREEEKEKC